MKKHISAFHDNQHRLDYREAMMNIPGVPRERVEYLDSCPLQDWRNQLAILTDEALADVKYDELPREYWGAVLALQYLNCLVEFEEGLGKTQTFWDARNKLIELGLDKKSYMTSKYPGLPT